MRACANGICILHHGSCLLVLDKIRTLSPLLLALFFIYRVRVFEECMLIVNSSHDFTTLTVSILNNSPPLNGCPFFVRPHHHKIQLTHYTVLLVDTPVLRNRPFEFDHFMSLDFYFVCGLQDPCLRNKEHN